MTPESVWQSLTADPTDILMNKTEAKQDTSNDPTRAPASPSLIPGVYEQQSLALETLSHFFSDKSNFETLFRIAGNQNQSIRDKQGKLSLRLLEFVCSKHSRTNPIEYKLPTEELPFNVYLSYEKNLQTFKKRTFDCFARGQKIIVKRDGRKLYTTTAQLNFFRWAIENEVIRHCETNLPALRNLLNDEARNKKKKRAAGVLENKVKGKQIKTISVNYQPTMYRGSFKLTF